MADFVFLATIVAFFVLCVGYVNLCGRIIGPDEIDDLESDTDQPTGDVRLERAA